MLDSWGVLVWSFARLGLVCLEDTSVAGSVAGRYTDVS